VIQARVTSVTFSTAVASAITFLRLLTLPDGNYSSALRLMGFWPLDLGGALTSLLLTAILFAGPLCDILIMDGLWKAWIRLTPVAAVWSEWTIWRNIVVVSSLFSVNSARD
jgi:prenyl protein peptidase